MKLNFYTEAVAGGYVGKCKQDQSLSYFSAGKDRNSRDRALKGVKRLAKKGDAKPRKVNRIALVIDRSGSMSPLITHAVDSLNENIETIKKNAKDTGQESIVSVYAFDRYVSNIKRPSFASDVRKIEYNEVIPDGTTALFDAVRMAIEELEAAGSLEVNACARAGKSVDVSYLVIVITDGYENASKTSAPELTRLMASVQSTDRWTLSFLVPHGSKSSLVAMGIPAGNISEWEQTVQGVQEYSQLNTRSLNTYYSARDAGQTKSMAFFQTDLSNVSSNTLKKTLDNISSQVRVLSVDKEEAIRPFVQRKLGDYKPGTAFYQLTKSEKKVQDYKNLLVMEKGKKEVFAGDDARSVLGIPYGDLSIKPGNHANFDVFIQSTSNNRKLVRGTKLVVKVK